MSEQFDGETIALTPKQFVLEAETIVKVFRDQPLKLREAAVRAMRMLLEKQGYGAGIKVLNDTGELR